MPGVLQADASASGSVRVEYDKERVDEAAIVAALGKLKVKPGKRTGSDHAGSHAGHDHGAGDHAGHDHGPGGHAEGAEKRSEERRGGPECVRTCRSRGSPYHHKQNNTNHTNVYMDIIHKK